MLHPAGPCASVMLPWPAQKKQPLSSPTPAFAASGATCARNQSQRHATHMWWYGATRLSLFGEEPALNSRRPSCPEEVVIQRKWVRKGRKKKGQYEGFVNPKCGLHTTWWWRDSNVQYDSSVSKTPANIESVARERLVCLVQVFCHGCMPRPRER
jgi:hypothetical protein